MSTHKPATPLPWRHVEFGNFARGEHGAALRQENGEPLKHGHNGMAVADAAYIAHVANAYPRLIEALKDCIATTDPDSPFFAGRVALLREMGEEGSAS